jgi:hypothetical protein
MMDLKKMGGSVLWQKGRHAIDPSALTAFPYRPWQIMERTQFPNSMPNRKVERSFEYRVVKPGIAKVRRRPCRRLHHRS